MAKQKQDSRKGECRHYLLLTLRYGRDGLDLWARCRHCSRSWFIGPEAAVVAGLGRLEGDAS
jgi:hypothetical protein